MKKELYPHREKGIAERNRREKYMENLYSRRDIPWTEEEEIQIGLYIDLLRGRNINHYKKVTKAISEGMEKPVQDLVREIFKRARIERNIVGKKL